MCVRTSSYVIYVFVDPELEIDDSTHAPSADHEANELTMNRAPRWQRLASETPEQREAHLVMERARRRRCLALETAEQRETRLSRSRA